MNDQGHKNGFDDRRHPGLASAPPSPWVVRFLPLVPRRLPIIDLACGGGRHGRLCMDEGRDTILVDRDVRGVADLAGHPGALVFQSDLERDGTWPFAPRSAAGLIVSRYWYRPTLDHWIDTLAAGGVLILETFADGNGRFGRPASRDHLVRSGEMLALADRLGLMVVAYEHGVVSSPRAAVIQRMCAVKEPAPAADLDGMPDPMAIPTAVTD